jgi:hypothetical protein
MHNVPDSLTIVIFSRVPAGSYLRADEPYLATHNGRGGDVHFRNVRTGSATFDRACMVAGSVWSAVTDRATLTAIAIRADDMFERNLRAAGTDRWSDAAKWPMVACDWHDVKLACDAAMGRSWAA